MSSLENNAFLTVILNRYFFDSVSTMENEDEHTVIALSTLLLGVGLKLKKKRRSPRRMWVKAWILRREQFCFPWAMVFRVEVVSSIKLSAAVVSCLSSIVDNVSRGSHYH